VAALALVAGLALGPIVRRQIRRLLTVVGVVAGVIGAASAWYSTQGAVREPLILALLELGLHGLATVLLAFCLGASLTGP
jgi:hypothetical protein